MTSAADQTRGATDLTRRLILALRYGIPAAYAVTVAALGMSLGVALVLAWAALAVMILVGAVGE